MTAVLACRRLWTPQGQVVDATVELDADGTVRRVRDRRAGDGDPVDGLVVPGLVHAHTHLELSGAGLVPGGQGFVAWAGAMLAAPPPPSDAGRAAARRLVELGVAWVQDVSNTGGTAAWLVEAGLRGVVQHELLTFDAAALPARLAEARRSRSPVGDVVVRPTPHALFSTAPELVVACVHAGPPGVPATIHVGESEDEEAFLRHGRGPHAALLDRLGRDWRWWRPPGTDAVGALDALGVLGPDLLLVHGVALGPDAIARAAAADAPICFCPRSNLHIGGRLPDVRAWLTAGARCALGTDALVSSPDLDLLAEVEVLRRTWPDVPPAAWLTMLTHGGADAVRARGVGRVAPGARPGLLELDAGGPDDLRAGLARRWCVSPA